jgi:hypothetical protein
MLESSGTCIVKLDHNIVCSHIDCQVKSSGTCIVKLDHNIVRSHIDCSYSYII